MNFRQKAIKELIKKRVKNQKEFSQAKREMAKKLKTPLISNTQLLKEYHNLLEKKRIKRNENFEKLTRKRPVRTLSGVAVVSLLTKPYPCPGKCIFCPAEKGLPKSYLRGEPAAERAFKLDFDPYEQVKKRVESLKVQGHPTDKIEIRIIGATFSYYPLNYKIWFLANLFAAANNRRKLEKIDNIKELKKEQRINEKSENRIVGISVETRPDLINKKEILLMRSLGVTMVELGVQTIFDDILKNCQRGHGAKEIILATKLLKNAGFKVMYQIMPNLPGSDLEKDRLVFKELFGNENYKPDWLKIYPCLVCKGAKLYEVWEKGNYRPYSNEELIELLIKIKKDVPAWTRIARLFRDIPAPRIEAGSKISNLREVVKNEMKKRKLKCKCIRCREVKTDYDPKEKILLFRENYEASGGKEIFLSLENKKRAKLFAFLRLRFPLSKNHFIPPLKGASIVRELHTYGQQIPLKEKGTAVQHKGFGQKLLKEAERITKKDFKMNKIAVISGVGVREYYKKLGYKLKDEYMIKFLR